MKSLNIKRAAAVASGLAMVGSMIAPGIAQVSVGDGVANLVSTMKSNLDATQCVVGTNGAAISDGVQCAKVVQALMAANYVASADGLSTDTTGVGATSTGDKSVTVTVAGGTTGTVKSQTTSTRVVEMTRTAAGTGAPAVYLTDETNKTIGQSEFPDALSKTTIQSTVNGSSDTYVYEEKIWLWNVNAQYLEATSTTYPGHGLYFVAPYTEPGATGETGQSTSAAIEYGIEFSGNGIKTGSGWSYLESPSIVMFGKEFGLDTSNTRDGQAKLFQGGTTSLNSGETVVTAEGVSVTFTTGSKVGTTVYGQFKVEGTYSDGTTYSFSTSQLAAGQSQEFGSGTKQITVFVDFVGEVGTGTYTGRVRVGAATITLTEGSPVPAAFGDDRWYVSEVNGTNTSTAIAGYVKRIKFRYGNPAYTTKLERGQFDTSTQYGLAQGVTVNGPKNLGTGEGYLFDLAMTGFGSTSSQVDTTAVKLQGSGSTTAEQYIRAEWTSRDGTANVFAPSTGAFAVFAVNETASLGVTMTPTTPTTIVNDKVVEFVNVDDSTSSNVKVTLRVGGLGGEQVTFSGFANASGDSQTGLSVWDKGANPITCTITINSVTSVTLGFAGTTAATSDASSGLCDSHPNIIPVGDATRITNTGGSVPYLDMLGAKNGTYADGSAIIVDLAGNVTFTDDQRDWSYIRLVEPNGDNITAVYDRDVTGDIDDTSDTAGQGFLLYNVLAPNESGYLNLTGATAMVHQVASTNEANIYENNKYHTTRGGSVIDGATRSSLTLDVPETSTGRNVILEITKTAAAPTGEAVEAGDQVVSEGGIVSGVTIKSITCPTATVTGLDSVTVVGGAGGALFERQAALTPGSLIATDTTATATYQIVVGGPFVNRVAQAMAAGQSTTELGAQVLAAESNKILAAGYSGTDTAAAVDELIKLLRA
ncbi:MAG: hypothetical protein J4432_00580 [DPANN group archaeon]|nr:hypothetical protein [DPANN group archaeon]